MKKLEEKLQPTRYDDLISSSSQQLKAFTASNDGWELLEQNDDIKIYTQNINGVQAHKSVIKLPFPPEAILAFLQDVRYRYFLLFISQ
jgi:hypothetical protein